MEQPLHDVIAIPIATAFQLTGIHGLWGPFDDHPCRGSSLPAAQRCGGTGGDSLRNCSRTY